jgi:hypothetical protein
MHHINNCTHAENAMGILPHLNMIEGIVTFKIES